MCILFCLVWQAVFDKGPTGASCSTEAALGDGGEGWSHDAMSTTRKMMMMVKAEQAKTAEELERAQKELMESKAVVKQLKQAVAERVSDAHPC